jgi:membrane protein implicated in regulation of membrane protease activity
MFRNAADEPPTIEFHAWPRPIPAHYLSFVQLTVLLALVMVLLLTVLPSLSFLHFIVGVLVLVSLFRRTRRRYPRREDAND